MENTNSSNHIEETYQSTNTNTNLEDEVKKLDINITKEDEENLNKIEDNEASNNINTNNENINNQIDGETNNDIKNSINTFSEEEIPIIREKATLIKDEANNYYKNKQYVEALNSYISAIRLFIPDYTDEMPTQYISSLIEGAQTEFFKVLSILFLNRGLSFKQLKEVDNAIDNFTKSVIFNSENEKAIYQRLDLNYNKGEYLDAQEDYNRLKSMKSKLLSEFKVSEYVLNALAEKKKQEMTNEMMGKLKDVGNSFLGLFGLSTNNFQFNQQPGGGYNIQFKN